MMASRTPAIVVPSNSLFIFQTKLCDANHIFTPDRSRRALPRPKSNPAKRLSRLSRYRSAAGRESSPSATCAAQRAALPHIVTFSQMLHRHRDVSDLTGTLINNSHE
jgi:hypothetical protein